jgi:hypothetical protein
MFVAIFRTRSGQSGEIAFDGAHIGSVVDTLERAAAQYKVYQGSAYLSPEHFGFGHCAGWLPSEQVFTQ